MINLTITAYDENGNELTLWVDIISNVMTVHHINKVHDYGE